MTPRDKPKPAAPRNANAPNKDLDTHTTPAAALMEGKAPALRMVSPAPSAPGGMKLERGIAPAADAPFLLARTAHMAGASAAADDRVPNYLLHAILATVCCCPPFGIVSIVHAAQVNGKVAIGDMKGARKLSHNARSWILVSLGVGLAFWIYVLLNMFA